MGIVVGTFAIFGLVALAYNYFGNGTLHVMTVGNGTVELVMDGKPVQARSKQEDHLVFEASRGRHEVKLTDASSGTVTPFSVEVSNGFTELLLPTRKDQCFLRFDMTEAAYSGQNTLHKNQSPTVEDRYLKVGEAIILPSNTYLTLEEMPEKVSSSERVYLLRDLPCDFAGEGANVGVQHLALSSRADELFSDPNGLINDLRGTNDDQ
ncbi:hypothetical protein [Hyalangium versicolor]|uniref:hypothetical protein n=1 Tax=Hyalangium versicolor TaxID=2861190 RepID=UPI001CCDEA10|nr:hypothetical protein [Hyalangium versicolor]